MKLSDIDYFQTLTFNIKYYILYIFKYHSKMFSLNLNNNEEFMKLFLKYYAFEKIN
jgi:hypothetical protein